MAEPCVEVCTVQGLGSDISDVGIVPISQYSSRIAQDLDLQYSTVPHSLPNCGQNRAFLVPQLVRAWQYQAYTGAVDLACFENFSWD